MPATPARQSREREKRTVDMDAKQAAMEGKFTEFSAGCEAGSVGACTSLGEWYSLMRQDFAKAATYYAPACLNSRYPQACWNLGNMLASGRPGVRRDVSLAVQALGLACEAGNSEACYTAGRLLLGRVQPQQSTTPNSSSTTAAAAAAAADTSEHQTFGNAPGLSAAPSDSNAYQNVALAERYLSVGCCSPKSDGSADVGNSCYLLAGIRIDPRFSRFRVPQTAVATTATAAVSSSGESVQLASGHSESSVGGSTREAAPSQRRGVGILPDSLIDIGAVTALAASLTPAELLERGCNAESSKACRALSQLYRSGELSTGDAAASLSSAKSFMRRSLLLQGHTSTHVDSELAKAGW